MVCDSFVLCLVLICLTLQHIKGDTETKERFIKSYRLMLDFFGFELTDEDSGNTTRSDEWKDRFYNFKR